MEKLSMNTDQIKAQGEELKAIASDLSTLLDTMYTQLTSIDSNGVWGSESQSGSANTFIENVKKDRTNNQKLCNNLNTVGNALIQYSNSISSSADTSVGR